VGDALFREPCKRPGSRFQNWERTWANSSTFARLRWKGAERKEGVAVWGRNAPCPKGMIHLADYLFGHPVWALCLLSVSLLENWVSQQGFIPNSNQGFTLRTITRIQNK